MAVEVFRVDNPIKVSGSDEFGALVSQDDPERQGFLTFVTALSKDTTELAESGEITLSPNQRRGRQGFWNAMSEVMNGSSHTLYQVILDKDGAASIHETCMTANPSDWLSAHSVLSRSFDMIPGLIYAIGAPDGRGDIVTDTFVRLTSQE